jgi:hypothetical protein
MGPYAGVGYNLTLCPLHSRLQHIFYLGEPYDRVDFIPQSGTLDLASEHLLKTEGTEGSGIYSMNKIGGKRNMFLTRETTAS